MIPQKCGNPCNFTKNLQKICANVYPVIGAKPGKSSKPAKQTSRLRRWSELDWELRDGSWMGAGSPCLGSITFRLLHASQKRSRASSGFADGLYWVNEKDVNSIDKVVFENREVLRTIKSNMA